MSGRFASSSSVAYAAPTPSYEGGVELQPARPAELLAHLSGAFDLAESQSPGHAMRVAYLALAVAEQLGIGALQRGNILFAGLLHDSGIAIRGLPADIDATGGHTAAGAWVALRFDLDMAERLYEAARKIGDHELALKTAVRLGHIDPVNAVVHKLARIELLIMLSRWEDAKREVLRLRGEKPGYGTVPEILLELV